MNWVQKLRFNAGRIFNKANSNLPSRTVQSLLASPKYSLDQYPIKTTYVGIPGLGVTKHYDPWILRQLGDSVVVSMITSTIKEEFISIPFKITPEDEETPLTPQDEEKQKYIEDFFNKPNPDDNYCSFMKKWLDDVLINDDTFIVKTFSKSTFDEPRTYTSPYKSLDKDKYIIKAESYEAKAISSNVKGNGVPTLEGNERVKLLSLTVADSATFYIQTDEYNRLYDDRPTYFNYGYFNLRGKPQAYWKREVSHASMNSKSYQVYGTSPVYNLIKVLELLLNAISFNSETFKQGIPPAFLIMLKDMPPDDIKLFMNDLRNQMAGRNPKVAATNKELKIETISPSAQEMQWLEGQKFYLKLALAMFRVNENEMGITETVNRAVGEVQSQINVRRSLLPLFKLAMDTFNSDVMPELDVSTSQISDRKFKFLIKAEDEWASEQKRRAEVDDVRAGILTVNEIRSERGLDPIDGGDELRNTGAFTGGFQRFPTNFGADETETKSINVQNLSTDYGSFLTNYYEDIQDDLTSGLPSLLEITKSVGIEKSWKDFIKRIIEKLNIGLKFKELIKHFVKRDFIKGLTEAEKQAEVQIGYLEPFNRFVDSLTEEQVEGYTMPDGKRWFGIRGVNEELKNELFRSIRTGLSNNETLPELKERVNKLFSKFSESRAMTIARTESDRMVNEGMMVAYKSVGFEGTKEWVVSHTCENCPICKELNGQKVKFNELFNGKYFHPPIHPNCSCQLKLSKGG